MNGGLIFAGDFNAQAIEWGMPNEKSRGRRNPEIAARTKLSVLKVGNTSTFRCLGNAETIPDASFASDNLAIRVCVWRVMKDYTGSVHQYMTIRARQQ